MRPTVYETMLRVCYDLACRAACAKRQVGCVLLSRDGKIIGTGYNGRARGMANCDALNPCNPKSCEGVHAEINALMQADPDKIETAFVSTFPCWHCVKALMNTKCLSIVTPLGPERDEDQERAHRLWLSVRRGVYEVDMGRTS